jgi:diaminohydroxyphosphoribosylaminopyrimidine deaminase / 5-amino-6-(5-phosphoribosylamino)uracil reductase
MEDKKFMLYALDLARKATGRTSPNPLVGCVIVKNNKIVAEGFHRAAGEIHAEVDALKKIKDTRNATMYITLEPCCHENKKTPPCCNAIINSGIKKVIIGSLDPNPNVNGKGIEALRKNKIDVNLINDVDLVEKIMRLNEIYNQFIKTKEPFVHLKSAITLDGKIATYSGDSKWISNDSTRKYAHELRNSYDAILVSSNTVIKDNPQLTCRIPNGRDPVRIICDSTFKTDLKSNVYKDNNFILATSEEADKEKLEIIKKKGRVIIISKTLQGLNLKQLFEALAKQQITSILIEGGNKLAQSLIKDQLVDKITYVIAPKILGNDARPAISNLNINHIKDAINLKATTIKVMDNNVIFEGYL